VQVFVKGALRVAALPRVRVRLVRLRPLARLLMPGGEDRVIWAVEATGRRLRGISTCLVRALVIEMRLASSRRPLALEVGVKRTPAGELHAHAWLHEDGRVLTGGPIDSDLVSILSSETAA